MCIRDSLPQVYSTYSHIVVDEAHERDVDMDLVLVTLRRMVIDGRTSSKRVPKVIIMSATVDA